MSASPISSTQRLEIPFDQFDHFVGFDWASEKHDACIVDRAGRIVVQLEFADTAEGWTQFGGKLQSLGRVAVAIETSRGAAVERLLSLGLTVYPMNPKAAERYRDRKAPSGVKDDTLDAWSFGDALRTDGRDWRPLLPEDPQSQLLRILCRDEIRLIEQRTALVLQLKAALYEYFPAALESFDDWTQRFTWEFVVQFPTPKAIAMAGKRRWKSFLQTHRLYHQATTEKRLEIFARADQFASPCGSVTTAKSLLAVTLAKTLRALQEQIDEYRKQIGQAFSDHPDGNIFASLPCGGERLAPRILGEMGSDRRLFESAESLQCYAGTAPVTKKSGKSRYVGFRRSCNMTLRTTIHLWADQSRHKCAWADAYYQQKKSQGMSHAKSLRCLGQRWLKIIWKMWQDRAAYDEARHMKSLSQSGSWVLGLLAKPAPAVSK